jgi:hypothetical protein
MRLRSNALVGMASIRLKLDETCFLIGLVHQGRSTAFAGTIVKLPNRSQTMCGDDTRKYPTQRRLPPVGAEALLNCGFSKKML